MANVDLLVSVHQPASLAASMASLGHAITAAPAGVDISRILQSEFSDLFVWDARDGLMMREAPAMIDIVGRNVCLGGETRHELTMRPGRRYAALIIAVCAALGLSYDIEDGWPVIDAQPPT